MEAQMRYLLFLALLSCGYHDGDLDHALDCSNGCERPIPTPTPVSSPETCSIVSISNGALIQCPDGSNTVIINGAPGRDGDAGMAGADGAPGKDAPPTAYTFTEIKDPCGAQSAFDEILFKTAGGPYVAYFAGSGGFLVLLHDGNYITTDGTSCQFTILNNEVMDEHN